MALSMLQPKEISVLFSCAQNNILVAHLWVLRETISDVFMGIGCEPT